MDLLSTASLLTNLVMGLSNLSCALKRDPGLHHISSSHFILSQCTETMVFNLEGVKTATFYCISTALHIVKI